MERYRADDNGIVFPGYFSFLEQVVRPLVPYLQPGQRGVLVVGWMGLLCPARVPEQL